MENGSPRRQEASLPMDEREIERERKRFSDLVPNEASGEPPNEQDRRQ